MTEQKAKTCPVCGKVFWNGRAKCAKCCSPECSLERNRQMQRRRNVKNRKERKEKKKAESAQRKRQKLLEGSLERVAKEARQAGMTYGQYVASKYARDKQEVL